jgi:tetratricopeptide (TPR) repeat protein
VTAYYWLGRLFAKSKNYETAIRHFESVLKFHPNDYKCLNNLGRCHIDLQQFDKAAAPLEIARNINPQGFLADYNLGYIKLILKKWEEALQILLSLFPHCPKQYEDAYYLALAQAYQGNNDYELAIAYFQKVTEYHPQWVYSYEQISKMYSEGECHDLAIPAQEQIVTLEPDSEKNWTTLVRLCFSAEQNQKAIRYARESLKHFPKSIYLAFHGARLLYEDGQYEEALELAQLAYALKETEPDHAALLGFVYSKRGAFEKAIHFFKEALSNAEPLSSGFSSDFQQISELLEQQGELVLAQSCRDQVLQLQKR